MSDQLFESESFAVVEVMGHNVFAGRVSEHTIGGTGFIRVDVPELPEQRTQRYGQEYVSPAIPAFTKIIGTGSIYAITPCSEEVARRVAREKRVVPVIVVDLQPSVTGLLSSSHDDEEPESDPFE